MANNMNKMTKVKILTGSLFGLAAVSLVGVAFSSWVIQGTNEVAFEGFNVSVSDVSDKRLVISAITSDDQDIVFDAKENDNTPPIVWDGTDNKEDLTFNFSFTISDVLDGQGKFKKDVGVNIKWDNLPAYSNLIRDNYITAPQRDGNALTDSNASLFECKTGTPIPSDEGNGLTFKASGEGSTDLQVTAAYSFAWGIEFEGKNPSEFATEENLSTVLTALDELKDLNGQKFTITLTSYVPA